MNKTGDLIQSDYFENLGGLNFSDSPFRVKDGQATNGYNFDYVFTGGIRKRNGHEKINSVADTQTYTHGSYQYNSASGTKFLIRVAGTKIQNFDPSVPSFTNLTEDTTAVNSTFASSSSQVPSLFSQFNNGVSNIAWTIGAGMSQPYGVYSSTKVTANGVPAPTGSITATVSATGGSFAATGTYYYAVLYRKSSTQAFSNAALDKSATISATTDKVTIDLTGISNNDTTKYDQIWIYRSAVSGAIGFTTGALIAQLASTATSYVDTGTSVSAVETVPRSDSLVLDNSVLPTKTYQAITVFKRRLVVAYDSTIRLSEVNSSEAWPTSNEIVVPSGGNITALGVISFTSPQANTLDELLFIMKERELWVITGDDIDTWILKFIDSSGTSSQASVVNGNGFVAFINYRGVFLWDGSDKPIYASRPVETLFSKDGDLDKTKLNLVVGSFFRRQNSIVWCLSHKTWGENKYFLKLDLRLTLPTLDEGLNGRVMDAVFTQDKTSFPVYAIHSYLPSAGQDEVLLLGDSSGFMYYGYNVFSDAASSYSFTYTTKYLDMNLFGQDKRFHKVIVWVKEVGNWPLYLDYWTRYKGLDSQKSTISNIIQTAENNGVALWDVAFWDVAFWDDFQINFRPLVFNLNAGTQNANEGDCIKLQFRNDSADQPVDIAGFSVVWSMKGLSK